MSATNVYTDDGGAPAILNVIRNAKEEVVLVSPYLDIWGHAQNEILAALDREVEVLVIARDEPDLNKKGDVDWLLEIGCDLYVVEGLHAKVYLNESETLVSSMNLTQYSAVNSHDLALLLEGEVAEQVRNYVNETLVPLATDVSEEE